MPQRTTRSNGHLSDLHQADVANAAGCVSANGHNYHGTQLDTVVASLALDKGNGNTLGSDAGPYQGQESFLAHVPAQTSTAVVAHDLLALEPPTLESPVSAGNPANGANLDGLMQSVNSFGALGSLYWHDHAPRESAPLPASEMNTSAGPYATPDIYLHAQAAHRSGPDMATATGGQHTEHKSAVPLPGDDDLWNGSCTAQKNPDGQTNFSARENGRSFPDTSGFDLHSFIQKNSALSDQELDAYTIGWLDRGVYIDPSATAPHISVVWSMGAHDQTSLSDFTASLLFRVGDNNELIYVGHKVLYFDGIAADGQPEAVSESAHWEVEPGQHYVTTFIVVESGQTGAPGAHLTIDSLEYSWLGGPEPAGDFSFMAENLADEATFATAMSELADLADMAEQGAAHLGHDDFSPLAENYQSVFLGMADQTLDELLPATDALPSLETLLGGYILDGSGDALGPFIATPGEGQDLAPQSDAQTVVSYAEFSPSLESMDQTQFEILFANS